MVVIPIVVALRSRVKNPSSDDDERVHGEFSVLGNDAEDEVADTGIYNGTSKTDRLSLTRYSRLVDSGEMKALSTSNRFPSEV